MRSVIGFSTGALYKHQKTKLALRTIRQTGCLCVELGFVALKEWKWLDDVTIEDLKHFSYVSFHAPAHDYSPSIETSTIIKKILFIHECVRRLDLVVVHPDLIRDFSALAASNLPIAIENMDRKKSMGRNPNDIFLILEQYPEWKMVLDLNHVYTNDQSMKLAESFIEKFGNKIAEIHLSGFIKSHDPLFETRQAKIIESAKGISVPIIVESLLSPENLEREKKYILKILKNSV